MVSEPCQQQPSTTTDSNTTSAADISGAQRSSDSTTRTTFETTDNEEPHNNSIPWSLVKSIAAQALALTVQEWTTIGQTEDPISSETAMFENMLHAVDRVAALLLVRIVGIHQESSINYYDEQEELSTSSICRHALLADDEHHPWKFISNSIWKQLKQFVLRMLLGYSSELPFHNAQHAATVVISCNKLLDLALNGTHSCYGLRENPLLLVALLLAALVHDVKHAGVKNVQLALENDSLALLYNDTSIQEKNSLHFAFAEFLKPDYKDLRYSLFGDDDAKYRYFRNTVISPVMATDLTCPEQTALTRSKWKEAFATKQQAQHLRRGSMVARARSIGNIFNRRGSNCSEVSEVTLDLQMARDSPKSRPLSVRDSPRSRPASISMLQSPVAASNRRGSGKLNPSSPLGRQLSSDSNFATQRWMHRRRSNEDASINDDGDAADSVILMQNKRAIPDRTHSETTKESQSSSFMSVAAESIGINKKRLEGGTLTKGRLRALPQQTPKSDNCDDCSSGSVTSSDEEEEYGGTVLSGMGNLDRRRESTNTGYRKRLGIRRSIDFSGEAIEVYSRRNSLGGVSALSIDQDMEESQNINEGLDYLRATAVLELLLRAADVGHFLQGWGNMTQWSSRMFLELQRAHKNGRGPDPCPDWFENQIKVMDLYLKPLACQLDECGIFGDFVGAMFAEIVDDIKARWLMHGRDLTNELLLIDPSESSFLPTDSSYITSEHGSSIGDLLESSDRDLT